MTKKVILALDAMGGDNAPAVVIKGAHIALKRHPDVFFHFYGDQEQIKKYLKKYSKLSQSCEVFHIEDVVSNDMKPSMALKKGRSSSMGCAIKAVQEGQAHGVVSAGNTGALMVLARFILKMLPGVDRPAICSFMPTLTGDSVMLDLGANIECDVENLLQFSIMGIYFAKIVLGNENPTFGLLNVGEEEIKGNNLLKETHQLLKEDKSMPGVYKGFVEGNDVPEGKVDVVVTDGFTGNVALKVIEGAAKLIGTFLKESFKHSLFAKLGFLFARSALKKLKFRLDPRRYNGAVLLGVNGIVVKSHGGTDELGYATAIGVAVDMISYKFNDKIQEELKEHNAGSEETKGVATA